MLNGGLNGENDPVRTEEYKFGHVYWELIIKNIGTYYICFFKDDA